MNASTVIPELQSCLTAIQKWMAGYKLKLNPDKTEFIVFGPKKKRDGLLKFFPIDILGVTKYPRRIKFVILVLFLIQVLLFLLR